MKFDPTVLASFRAAMLREPILRHTHVAFVGRRISRPINTSLCAEPTRKEKSCVHLIGEAAREYAAHHSCPKATYPAQLEERLHPALRKWANSTKTSREDPNLRSSEVLKQRQMSRAKTCKAKSSVPIEERSTGTLHHVASLVDRLVPAGTWPQGLVFSNYAFMNVAGGLPKPQLPEEIGWDKGDPKEVAIWNRQLYKQGLPAKPRGDAACNLRATTRSPRTAKKDLPPASKRTTGPPIWNGLPFTEIRCIDELRPFPAHWQVNDDEGFYVVVLSGNHNRQLIRLNDPAKDLEATRAKRLAAAAKKSKARYKARWRQEQAIKQVSERINHQFDTMAVIYCCKTDISKQGYVNHALTEVLVPTREVFIHRWREEVACCLSGTESSASAG